MDGNNHKTQEETPAILSTTKKKRSWNLYIARIELYREVLVPISFFIHPKLTTEQKATSTTNTPLSLL